MLARWVPQNGGIERSSSLTPSVDSLLDETFTAWSLPLSAQRGLSWGGSAADIAETEDAFHVSVELPGYDPKSVEVKIEGDTLTIQAERKQPFGNKFRRFIHRERAVETVTFARSFVLPNTVDSGKCEAEFEHGLLTVTLPKREEARPRSVQIKVQS